MPQFAAAGSPWIVRQTGPRGRQTLACVGPNKVTVGTPSEAATCPGPESFPTNRRASPRRLTSDSSVRQTSTGAVVDSISAHAGKRSISTGPSAYRRGSPCPTSEAPNSANRSTGHCFRTPPPPGWITISLGRVGASVPRLAAGWSDGARNGAAAGPNRRYGCSRASLSRHCAVICRASPSPACGSTLSTSRTPICINRACTRERESPSQFITDRPRRCSANDSGGAASSSRKSQCVRRASGDRHSTRTSRAASGRRSMREIAHTLPESRNCSTESANCSVRTRSPNAPPCKMTHSLRTLLWYP